MHTHLKHNPAFHRGFHEPWVVSFSFISFFKANLGENNKTIVNEAQWAISLSELVKLEIKFSSPDVHSVLCSFSRLQLHPPRPSLSPLPLTSHKSLHVQGSCTSECVSSAPLLDGWIVLSFVYAQIGWEAKWLINILIIVLDPFHRVHIFFY